MNSVFVMARRKKQPVILEKRSFFDDLSPHTKQAIGAVAFVVLGVYFALALAGVSGMAGDINNTGSHYILGGGV